MGYETILPETLRGHYQAIVQELQPLIDDESYAQAIARLDMMLRSIPTDQPNRLMRGVLLAKRGELYLEEERFEDAEEDIRHAIHNGIKHPELYTLAGWAHYSLEQFPESRAAFDRALDEDGDIKGARLGRAMVAMENDEYDLAQADLSHAITLDAKDPQLLAMRADAYLAGKQLKKAEHDLKKASLLSPTDQDITLELARIFSVTKRHDEALAILERTLEKDDAPSLELLLLRAHLKLMTGDTDGASQDAMTASNRFPDEAFAFVQLSQVQLAQGKVDLALEAATRAVKLDQSLPDAYLARGAAHQIHGASRDAQADFERASHDPSELPSFLFGAAYDAIDIEEYQRATLEMLQGGQAVDDEAAGAGGFEGINPFGNIPGMGGMDPMKLMSQMFDDEGNVRGPFKGVVDMALKNAPSILKNMPPGLLKKMGGLDKEMLDQVDFNDLSADQLQNQMKEFHRMVKEGKDPAQIIKEAREEVEKNKK